MGHFNGHSYFFLRQHKTAEQHKTYANGLGAYLFNPNSNEEFAFIDQNLLSIKNWAVPITINDVQGNNNQEHNFLDQAFIGIQYNNDGYSAYKLSEQNQTSNEAQITDYYQISSIAPGQKIILSFTKTILDSEIDLGGYSNSVTVTADNNISQVSDDPTTTQEDDPTVVNFDIVKELEVIKTADVVDSPGNNFNDVDDTINYTISVKNTGTVPLYDIVLEDELTTRGTFDPDDPTPVFQSKSVPSNESLAPIWASHLQSPEPDNSDTGYYNAALMYWNGPGYYLHDYRTSTTVKYIAESDDPNLTSISGYTHLGVYNGHSYFSYNTSTNFDSQASNARSNTSIYMLLIDSVDEWDAVRNMLIEKGINENHWIGLRQKLNKTHDQGWYWIGKDSNWSNNYDPDNPQASNEAADQDNYPFYWEDQEALVSTNDGVLNPGETANYTVSYIIEQNAVTDGGGFIENTVVAKANSSVNQGTTTYDVQDTSDGDTADEDGDDDGDFENDPTVISLPRIKVTKTSTVNDDNGEDGINAGDTIDYTITVENIGGDTLDNISFEDTFVDADGNVLVYDSSNMLPKTGAVFDHEGNSYEFVTFNSQDKNVALQYMTSNYGPTTYTDGTPIPQVPSPDTWKVLSTGAWRWADPSDPAKGKLYNKYAIDGIHDTDPDTPNKQFVIDGWRVSSNGDWTSVFLYAYLREYGYASLPWVHATTRPHFAQSIASKDYWQSGYMTENPSEYNNLSGLNLIPSGYVDPDTGITQEQNQAAYLHSYTGHTWGIKLRYNYHEPESEQSYGRKGMSVRLVRDYRQEANIDRSLYNHNQSPTPIVSTNLYSYSQSLYPKEFLDTGDSKWGLFKNNS